MQERAGQSIRSKLYTCGTQLQISFIHLLLFGTLRNMPGSDKRSTYLNKPVMVAEIYSQ